MIENGLHMERQCRITIKSYLQKRRSMMNELIVNTNELLWLELLN